MEENKESRGIFMLDMEKVQQMTDIVHTSIPYSGIEHAVISTPIYNRLHRILQSSLVFLTYPSNKIKRFEHSVGVMHLAGNIFFNSICNSSPTVVNTFMNSIKNELIHWRKNLNFDKNSFVATELRTQFKGQDILNATVPKSMFYNKYYPKNLDIKNSFAYYVVFQAVRLAGLLHDVGHLPYSHILEHALKRMYASINNKSNKNKVEDEFLHIMERFAIGDDGDEIHEEIGKLLVSNIRSTIIQDIGDKADPDIYFFLASFDFAERIICSNFSDGTIFSDLHLITASVLDADRLDYCSRDSICSGINNSVFAYERLIDTYKLSEIIEDGSRRFFFCPSYKSLPSIEELLRRRYNIFAQINFHHRVHKHEILLEEVISFIGIKELSEMKEVDSLSYTLPLKVSSIWNLISKLNSKNDWPEYQIIQLDDSWLDTLLKHNFFAIYGTNYLSLRANGNDVLWNKFDELISSTKRYISFIKRSNDFREFDKLFFAKFIESYNGIDRYITDIITDNLSKMSHNDFYRKHHSFIFNYIIDKICITDTHKEIFFTNFENEMNKLVIDKDFKISNCLLRPCMFSLGCNTSKTPLYLTYIGETPIMLEQVSSQLETFQRERAISPIFHLYYLPTYNNIYNAYDLVDKNKIMNLLVDSAINTIKNFKKTNKVLDNTN